MSVGMTVLIVVLAVLFITIIAIYNRLVALRARGNEAWAQIDVQLKKRADLIPNLVEAVKGYAAHEKEVLTRVTEARAAVQGAGNDVGKAQDASNMLTGALKSLFAVVENYPELKANENFLNLQNELSAVESKLSYARQFYNETVRLYNEYQQKIPAVFFAGIFGHSKRTYFEIEEADRKAPQVKF
ncbi:MAG: LemA family protein [Candidatus Goldiibacteriota bacterium]